MKIDLLNIMFKHEEALAKEIENLLIGKEVIYYEGIKPNNYHPGDGDIVIYELFDTYEGYKFERKTAKIIEVSTTQQRDELGYDIVITIDKIVNPDLHPGDYGLNKGDNIKIGLDSYKIVIDNDVVRLATDTEIEGNDFAVIETKPNINPDDFISSYMEYAGDYLTWIRENRPDYYEKNIWFTNNLLSESEMFIKFIMGKSNGNYEELTKDIDKKLNLIFQQRNMLGNV